MSSVVLVQFILLGLNVFLATIISSFILLFISLIFMGFGARLNIGGIFLSVLVVNIIDQIFPIVLLHILGLFGALLLAFMTIFLKVGELLILMTLLDYFYENFLTAIIVSIIGIGIIGIVNWWVGYVFIPVYMSGVFLGAFG